MPTTGRIQQRRTYLMCRPEHFTVSYTINPWMEPANPTDTSRALRQWQALYDTYLRLGHDVELIDPIPGLPDMVYTANGGFVVDGIAYGARFRFQERVPEGPAFMDWFRDNGYDVVVPREVNEGEGDFLLVGDTILAGTGFRSTGDSHREVGEVFGREVVSLQLVDPRFYHLDTAIAVLDPVEGPGGVERADIAYLPHAFDERSQGILADRYPDAIRVSDDDGAVFGLNSASDGRNVIISPRAKGFEAQLRERGYTPVLVDLSELLLGGGGIKCCTLELRGPR
ncbi:dimethylargininase [Microbacterium ulmi]|uniref:N-dimethylarginine dimethylaminohydrolase n=1 Tax=Microbacterium ulmi TaxID=179095 RepID=A0A7Y2M1A1_9MICO|nr:dimethylargininase [Microbacterium ulmi]NII69061.1 N-dimethylarginine dimethylaminohydrolase [Microbacterium ulmi]NNH04640.1 N-dimethylarginine dimethylaminohydrolase [Microbacterium ulmi]